MSETLQASGVTTIRPWWGGLVACDIQQANTDSAEQECA